MRILLLAGTAEARELAERLAGFEYLEVTASLAGATRVPAEFAVPVRVGGFGGIDGLRAYLREASVDLVIDATHPFAARMTHHAHAACTAEAIPLAILQRPAWVARPQDHWHNISTPGETDALIPESATVFLGTGRQTLNAFACLQNRRVIARVIDPPSAPFPFANGCFQVGRPPFSVEEEMAFLSERGIDWLVVKNAGGTSSFSKLEAAARLGLPVAMLARPDLPKVLLHNSICDTLEWVMGQL